MWKTARVALLAGMMMSCAPGLAPNGMSWDDYLAAKYRLQVTYDAADVAGCHELGNVRGTGHEDIGAAKDNAVEEALMLRGNAILFEKLWSDWSSALIIRRVETFFAEGRVFRCAE